MEVWITKYALTTGILQVDGVGTHAPNMISYNRGGCHFDEYAHNGDWHKSEHDAIKKAEEMKIKKIASLKNQIAKLESMTFKITSC